MLKKLMDTLNNEFKCPYCFFNTQIPLYTTFPVLHISFL